MKFGGLFLVALEFTMPNCLVFFFAQLWSHIEFRDLGGSGVVNIEFGYCREWKFMKGAKAIEAKIFGIRLKRNEFAFLHIFYGLIPRAHHVMVRTSMESTGWLG